MNGNAILEKKEDRLKRALIGQYAKAAEGYDSLIEEAKTQASAYSQATEGIAVISDYSRNECHIYSGKFGQGFFGLPTYFLDKNSAFEDIIFNKVLKEDLLERHILELRFLNILKTLPSDKRLDYEASCIMRLPASDSDKIVTILHTTRQMGCLPDGSALCGICTYIPIAQPYNDRSGGIVNIATGEAMGIEQYEDSTNDLLSKRQVEVLSLLAKGMASKQIAERLFISQNTVNRHRQDILSALRVTNTAAAVETALRMRLV